ncbi:hypothetical protein SAMN04515665_103128 [Blastococcus sp. DSM 46786]|uniref:hypothetical protein n=1 Tax=Blastococcus sp. DSM 46786 TaxID=1798227 RepID=UPI0008D3D292|nr:hypothetical protein [Blastococcus sp. DSM 46786]SEK59377.1 hypothetical protein SAMN04515665_103128 [Blastococcus sp. DSM 46786]
MRELTGQEELTFVPGTGTGPAGRLTALLSAVDAVPPESLRTLPLAAWEALLLDLRVQVVGPAVHAELRCPDCGAGVAVDFDAHDLPREPPAPRATPVPLAPLTVGDVLALEEAGTAGEAALSSLLAAAADIDADEAGARLHGAGRDQLLGALDTLASGLGLELGTRCTDCDAAITAAFDIPLFVDAELASRGARLLDEVHLLARTYHWSESEILALPYGRRQEYLRRILLERPPALDVDAVA